MFLMNLLTMFLMNLLTRSKRPPLRPVRLNLEPLEERWCPATVTYEWRPQPGTISGSDGGNWYNTTTHTTGVSPLTGGGNVVFSGAYNTGIIWDAGGNPNGAIYDVDNVQVESGYNSRQEIPQSVTINTAAVNSVQGALLNLYFDGPQGETNGSYFYVGPGANSIADWNLAGSTTNRPSGNFVIDPGATLDFGDGGLNASEPVNNTTVDVQGGLALQPSSAGIYSPIALQNGGWLRAVPATGGSGGLVTMQDNQYVSNFVTSDGNTDNTVFVYSYATLRVYTNVSSSDVIQAPVDDMGTMAVYGGAATGSRRLRIEGGLSPDYGGNGMSLEVIAQPNSSDAYLLLYNQVFLECENGYGQYGVDSTHTAQMQTDTSGNTVQTDYGASLVIGDNSSVVFVLAPTDFGALTFNSVDVEWEGNLQVYVGEQFQCDVVKIQGNVTFTNTAFILPLFADGNTMKGTWSVITCTGSWTGWSNALVQEGWMLGGNGCVSRPPL